MSATISEYRLRRRVLFYEADPAGIVHFSWFFRYMEEAEHALWRAAGLSIAPKESEFVFPRINAEFDYHNPLRFEDEFDVHIRIAAMTDKTMRYACVLTRGATKIATGSLTIVCATRQGDDIKSASFPPAMAARFAVAPEPESI
jgi:YbgC/YbaW family acyl-CoA thioester hydrolase